MGYRRAQSKLAGAFAGVLLFSAGMVSSQAAPGFARDDDQRSDQRIPAEATVIVSVCVTSGDVTVRGTDRPEVRARVDEDVVVELRRMDIAPGAKPGAVQAAARVEVLIANRSRSIRSRVGECQSASDLILDVPRGATVYVTTREGDVDVSDFASAKINTLSGDIGVQRISKSFEGVSLSGDILIEDSSGNVRLQSTSGRVEAQNLKPASPTDAVSAISTSGDVMLSRVSHARVEARSVSGELEMVGALAQGGHYEFTTTLGDIRLIMPETVSFQIDIRVSRSAGDIVTQFPIKGNSNEALNDLSRGRLVGTYGKGDPAKFASLNLQSFSGSIRLLKK